MPDDLGEFKQKLINHAKIAVARAEKTTSEAATNIQLVQPFLALLGYDVTNPDEVSPEHHADFSDKYQNKVDYAILRAGKPVIAIESKKVGAPLKDDRGQLKSYFNACPTVKLGILTDGLQFEFYADSDKQNMMDDTAFLRLDLREVAAKGDIDETAASGLAATRRGSFNPENVGAEAKRKLLIESIVCALKGFKEAPSDDFVRFFLMHGEVGKLLDQNVTRKLIENHRQDVREAIGTFVAQITQEALANFSYAHREATAAPADRPPEAFLPPPTDDAEGAEELSPTEQEKTVFTYARDRLLFLVRSEVLFHEVSKVRFKKSPSTFKVFYDRPNAGSLFNYKDSKTHKYVLRFLCLGDKEMSVDNLNDVDEALLQAFTQRVRERGIQFETPPVLRTIPGGAGAA